MGFSIYPLWGFDMSSTRYACGHVGVYIISNRRAAAIYRISMAHGNISSCVSSISIHMIFYRNPHTTGLLSTITVRNKSCLFILFCIYISRIAIPKQETCPIRPAGVAVLRDGQDPWASPDLTENAALWRFPGARSVLPPKSAQA